MNRDKKHHLERIVEKIAKDPEILALFLYGSSARKEDCEQSDVDLCLVLMPASYAPKALSEKK